MLNASEKLVRLAPACFSLVRHLSSVGATCSNALQKAINPAVCNHYASKGYAVVDHVFGADLAHELRREVMQLYHASRMHKNCTHLVKDNRTTLLEKSHIHEAELSLDASIQAEAPLCSQLNADRTLATMLSLHLPQLTLDSQAIKLQVNSGQGGCFPCHLDSDEMLDGRRVTCIFYLNPSWKPGDGGELRLYPFPQSAPVDIAPLHDRLVLFASTRMLHRVLPSEAAERACFTIWLSQSRRRAPVRQAPSLAASLPDEAAMSEPEAVVRFLQQPHVRKHVLKLVYADEWAQSLEQSHPDGPGRAAALEQHYQEVALIRRALDRFLPAIDLMRRELDRVNSSAGAAASTPLLPPSSMSVAWL